VNCDYCNTVYAFDAVDCKALFVPGSSDFQTVKQGSEKSGAKTLVDDDDSHPGKDDSAKPSDTLH